MADFISEQLEQMTDNPRMVRALRDGLRQLSGGSAGPELAEMAESILNGGIQLRDVARSSAYSGALSAALERFRDWEAGLGPTNASSSRRRPDGSSKVIRTEPERLVAA